MPLKKEIINITRRSDGQYGFSGRIQVWCDTWQDAVTSARYFFPNARIVFNGEEK